MQILQEYPVLLAVAIFCARIADVSLGTLRTILVFRSHRVFAAALGFIEILIWLAAAGQVFQNLDRWYLAVAYAGGFSCGTFVGIWLESKLALGSELLRAVSYNREVELARELRDQGISVTELVGSAGELPVEVLLMVEKRRRLPALLQLIHDLDPDAVCTSNDVRERRSLPPRRSGSWLDGRSLTRRKRK